MVDEARQAALGKRTADDLWWSKRTALKWLPDQVGGRYLIDVGSGPGTFLAVAQRLGWRVDGLEISSDAARIANDLGIPTVCAPLAQTPDKFKGRFDALTCFEVLEHVPDPREFARHLRSLIKEQGVAFLSVPNRGDPYVMRLTIPEATPPIHVNFFNAASIRLLLRQAGFSRVQTHTLPIPTASVRILFGKSGLLKRIPLLAVRSLLGQVDGTTLLVKCWA